MAYPPGVSHRRPRPRREKTGGGALFGAVVGGLFGGPVGALAGGAFGHGAETPPPLPLEAALQVEFEKLSVSLIQLYRRGPFRLEALFMSHGNYWTVASTAPRVHGWQQVDLDDWLFGDLVDCQLIPWLQANPVIFR